jgi:hypothetical protein
MKHHFSTVPITELSASHEPKERVLEPKRDFFDLEDFCGDWWDAKEGIRHSYEHKQTRANAFKSTQLVLRDRVITALKKRS